MKKFGGYIMLLLIIANLFAPLSVTTNYKNIIQENVAHADDTFKIDGLRDYCNNNNLDYCFNISSSSATWSSGKAHVIWRITALSKEKITNSNYLNIKVEIKEVSGGTETVVLSKEFNDSNSLPEMLVNGVDPVNALTDGKYNWYSTTVDQQDAKASTTYKIGMTVKKAYMDPTTKIMTSVLLGGAAAGGAAAVGGTTVFLISNPVGWTVLAGIAIIGTIGYVMSGNESNDTTKTASLTTPAAPSDGNGPNFQRNDVAQGQDAESTPEVMPACSLNPTVVDKAFGITGTFMGCIAQGFYYVVFVPTSFVFALAGKFFDFAFKYSISDKSYRSTFVIEGWKIVRDLCNIFFIFVLLMAAVQMILDIGHGAKDAIIKVVVIGLLINFSLFTTQIIIDSSNILARLFYNSDAVSVMMKKDGMSMNRAGIDMVYPDSVGNTGEIPISAAIVAKVNPQSIILNASKVNVSDPAGLSDTENNATFSNGSDNKGIGAGTFILVTLLASAVNITGLFIFLSIGLMFVARVIGLWFAMILVPLAFFSYTTPKLDNMSFFGWKKWWPETLSLAFMAPVFMFFMYLILIFLDNSFLDLSNVTSQTGANFILSIILPFAFIIILLNQAKSVAKKMSGEIGGMVTNYTTAAGGMLLGGAALGTAMIGRQTVGAVTKYAMNDGARQNAMSFKGVKDARAELTGLNRFNPLAYAKVGVKAVTGLGSAAAAGLGHGVAQIGKKTDEHTGKTTSWIQRKGKDLGNKTHADHVLEEYTQSTYHDKNKTWGTLTEEEQQTVKGNIDKDMITKEVTNTNKKYEALNAQQKTAVDSFIASHRTGNMTESEGITAAAIQAKDYAHLAGRHRHTADDVTSDSKLPVAMSEFVNALRKGSYDMRNLSGIETKSKGFIPSLMVGATSGVASMMRNGLKDTVGINHGKGNKDFMKDMKEVLTEAFKTAKLEVKLPESHGGGGHDDHGGGHDDHGGGHH